MPRALLLVALLVAPALAGCAAQETPERAAPMIAALDGRWPFDAARASAILAAEGVEATGALVFAEALVQGGAAALVDAVGLDARAAEALGVAPPAPGELVLARETATRAGVGPGDAVTLHGVASPVPYVASYHEMERLLPCERAPERDVCFLPSPPGETRIRLVVHEGARDAGFLPDLVELGARGRPAWWNGTFTAPGGATTPFQAYAGLDGVLVPAELAGDMEAGAWTIAFTLDANGTRAGSGAAGIVRVREPGYLWFDDRLPAFTDARTQAQAVLANLTPTQAALRVARVEDALPLGATALLAIDDARVLAGAGADEATALLANATRAHAQRLDEARGPDALEQALRLRALPAPRAPRAQADVVVLAAPLGTPVPEGASLALAARAPVGERVLLNGTALDPLLLALAEGPAPWTMPPGGRWTSAEDALENLTRSRTLLLASEDLLEAPLATLRAQVGEGNASRALLAIGRVEGGPAGALWGSAAYLAGSGKPGLPRLLVPADQAPGLLSQGYALDD